MKILTLTFAICGIILFSCNKQGETLVLGTDHFQISVQKNGYIDELIDKSKNKNYLAADTIAPLLALKIGEKHLYPLDAHFDQSTNTITLDFENDIQANLKYLASNNHIRFEFSSIVNGDEVELALWGPYPTTLGKIIGETVGVVQGDEFAIGIQSLHPKTLGGYPWNDNDCMPQIDIFEQDDYADLSEENKREVLYRVEAAKPTDHGSSLQAYCRNRNKERIIENWGHPKYQSSVFEDQGIIGSKIALFGCPIESILPTISEIELKEGLPHPTIDGQWGKTSPTASASYIIMGFDPENIERALDVVEKAGLRYLYHPDPFTTWGHFDLKSEQFPNGLADLKACVETAKSREIMLGLHTLSNFITTNDKYVSPIPDNRLAVVGHSSISEAIDEKQTNITIDSPQYFNQFENNNLKTVRIGNELIRYGSVSTQSPWELLDCQRGAFATTIASHSKGETISLLADHGYKVFLSNPELSIEISKNIADIYNKTGLRQISFDGLEGNRSTGMGNYGEILFTNTWFEQLSNDIKQHYIADASRTSHYFWHIYSRMNWGEPWYAGFRESQTEYRLKNQAYFKRNLMPGMLGWFSMRPEVSIEDIEWMLARSAAFDAGYGFVTNFESLEKNGQTEEILDALKLWEKARIIGAFTEEQKDRMKSLENEFHLEPVEENQWMLYQVHSYKFKHEKKIKQPGEPLHSTFSFNNPAESQILSFLLTAVKSKVSNIKLEIDNYKDVILPITLENGETLKYIGGNKAVVYNGSWQIMHEVAIDGGALRVSPGDHTIRFDCNITEENDGHAKFEVRLNGQADRLNLK